MGFNRIAGIILAPTNSTVFCGDSTCPPICSHKSRTCLFDSCHVVVVCLSCFFVRLAYIKWIRHPIHWELKALVYWRVTRRAIMGGRSGSDGSAKLTAILVISPVTGSIVTGIRPCHRHRFGWTFNYYTNYFSAYIFGYYHMCKVRPRLHVNIISILEIACDMGTPVGLDLPQNFINQNITVGLVVYNCLFA